MTPHYRDVCEHSSRQGKLPEGAIVVNLGCLPAMSRSLGRTVEADERASRMAEQLGSIFKVTCGVEKISPEVHSPESLGSVAAKSPC